MRLLTPGEDRPLLPLAPPLVPRTSVKGGTLKAIPMRKKEGQIKLVFIDFRDRVQVPSGRIHVTLTRLSRRESIRTCKKRPQGHIFQMLSCLKKRPIQQGRTPFFSQKNTHISLITISGMHLFYHSQIGLVVCVSAINIPRI